MRQKPRRPKARKPLKRKGKSAKARARQNHVILRRAVAAMGAPFPPGTVVSADTNMAVGWIKIRPVDEGFKNRKKRGAPTKQSTVDKIALVRGLLATGRSARSFALEVFPEKQTIEAADAALRKFRSDHRKEIEQEK